MIALDILSLIRFAIAIVVIGLIPGWALLYLLFPRADFDRIEHAFLILVGSVTISSLTAVALTWTATGLQPMRYFVALIVISLAMGAGALVRRKGRSALQTSWRVPETWSHDLRGRIRRLSRNDRELALFLGALILLFGISFLRTESATPVTEFYFPTDQIETLVVDAADGQTPARIPFVIANHSTEQHTYRVEAWIGDTKLTEQSGIVAAAETEVEETLDLPASTNASRSAIDLHLYTEATSTPLAQLRLWRGTESSAAGTEPVQR